MFSFFFNHPETTEIYTLSLPAALPISSACARRDRDRHALCPRSPAGGTARAGSRRSTGPASSSAGTPRRSQPPSPRSEEHTSELQSRQYLVCRLLLEKNKVWAAH